MDHRVNRRPAAVLIGAGNFPSRIRRPKCAESVREFVTVRSATGIEQVLNVQVVGSGLPEDQVPLGGARRIGSIGGTLLLNGRTTTRRAIGNDSPGRRPGIIDGHLVLRFPSDVSGAEILENRVDRRPHADAAGAGRGKVRWKRGIGLSPCIDARRDWGAIDNGVLHLDERMQLYLSIAVQGDGSKAFEVVVHFQNGAVGHGDTVGAERIVARAFEVAGIDGPSAVVGVRAALEIIRRCSSTIDNRHGTAARNRRLKYKRAQGCGSSVVKRGVASE